MSPRSSRPGGNQTADRRLHISKSLSWLLRHGAPAERIPISTSGYILVSDLLSWPKLRREGVTFQEIVDEVQGNAKQRFGLLYRPPANAVAEAADGVIEKRGEESVRGEGAPAGTQSETEVAIAAAASDAEPAHFMIRAVQGHSIASVVAEGYLTRITLASISNLEGLASEVPSTVVHGTFYAAWEAILRSGGLRPMSRLHVHFADGPSLGSLLERQRGAGGAGEGGASASLGEEKAVRSGMRSDAQILIYVNVRRALEMGIPFWRSENGVLLSEGMAADSGKSPDGNVDEGYRQERGESKGKEKDHLAKEKPMMKVPTACWDTVVEVKAGLGVIWQDGKVVKELPDYLKKMGWPHRKGGRAEDGGRGGGRGRGRKFRGTGQPGAGRGAKPRSTMERDDINTG